MFIALRMSFNGFRNNRLSNSFLSFVIYILTTSNPLMDMISI